MFYVGLADVRLNIECIALRVKNGGYHIETEDIVRRNLTSMNNLISHSELIVQVKCYLNGLPGCTQEINRKLQIKYNMQKGNQFESESIVIGLFFDITSCP